MSSPRQVWVLAASADPWRGTLVEELTAQGMLVEQFDPGRAGSWVAVGAMPEVRSLPHLLIMSMATARAQEWGILRLLDRPAPWRCIPQVVIASDEDPAAVRSCHGLGVSSVVALERPAMAGEATATHRFARYWARTVLLPNVESSAT